MQLPFLSDKNTGGELYCGILLKEAQGICYIFEKKDTSIRIIKQREFQYMNGWEHIVDDVDNTLSLIEQEIAGTIKLTHCIFFVFTHLIDPQTKEIAKQYSSKIRDLANNLELKPLGYMEVIDAVHEQLQQEKQIALSSIVVELDDTMMTVFLFKGGHKIAIQRCSRTDNFAADMDSALEAVAETHILPTHIYLYDSSDLAEESSDLMLHAWKKNIFIQQPRVVVVAPSTVNASLKNLLERQLCSPETLLLTAEKKDEKKEVLGFTIGKEVMQQEEVLGEEAQTVHFTKPAFSFPKFSLPAMPLLAIVGGLVALIAGTVGFLYFFHKATISITIPTEKKQAEVTILAGKSPEKENVTELQNVVSSFSATEKKDTTGKRDIGEKSAGEVTLYNYDEKTKELAKGTNLKIDALQFETDDAANVPASQFGSDGITKNPGKSKVKVRAVVLGPESNIDKNKRFSIPGISSNTLFAINESAITGGTKKTVQTIAKVDIESIRALVLDKAKKDALGKQIDSSYLLIPELTTATIKTEKPSGEIGEEASKISYTGSGEVTIYRIQKKLIEEQVQKKLESEKPLGYETSAVQFSVKKQTKIESGDMQLVIEGSVEYKKTMSSSEILKAVIGKNKIDAVKIIETTFGTQNNEITIQPAIPLIQDQLPFWGEHIRVELTK